MLAFSTPKYILIYSAIAFVWLTSFQVANLKPLPATSSFSYSILPGSRISVLGSTNVNEFTCFSGETSSNSAGGFLFNEFRNTVTFQHAVLNLNTQSLECGNAAMNHNLWEALHADKYPSIIIDLQQAKSKNGQPLTLSSVTPMTASVYITLAGVRRLNQIDFTAKQISPGTYHFIGSHDLLLTDYYINPPCALFGLIKVKNTITVKFDLQVNINAVVLE